MITLKLNANKDLRIIKTTKIFNGENKIEKFKIVVSNTVCDTDISECKLYLFVFNEQDEYIKYPIELSNSSDGSCYVGEMDITQDITTEAQTLKLYIKITKDDEVIGYSDYVPLTIHETICGGEEIVPREELTKRIAELETEITEKTNLINQLQVDVQNKSDEILQLQAEISQLQEEKSELQNKLNEKDTTIEQLTSDLKGIFERDITKIVIPNGVTKIGDGAFKWCKRLINITIPDSVTYMGDEAFYYCYDLTSIRIPDNVTSIRLNAFSHCESLENIIIGNRVKEILNSAFAYCYSLTNVIIPNSVTSISNYAFDTCTSLANVTIPNSVKKIGTSNIFWKCTSLENVVIENGFNCDGLNLSVSTKYTAETIVSWLNALYDRTGLNPYTLIIGSDNIAKLSEEQIAIATDKNWTLA